MIRHILSFAVVGLLAVAVGAQGPKALTASQKAELFTKNRDVIEKIVTQTVASSKLPNNPLKRAESYYDLLFLFSKQIQSAGQANDGSRVKELTSHLNTLIEQGLAPTMQRAKIQMEDGTGVEEFRKVRIDLLAQLDALLGLQVMNDNPDAKSSLEGAKARLNGIVIPEPK
jgi:hypothetical protein